MAKTVSDDIMLESASEANAPPFGLAFAEAASQTFLKGWLVNLVAGYVTAIASDTPGNILGLAEQDAHNLSASGSPTNPDQSINVSLANATNIFSANVKGASLADHVLVQSDIGVTMGIQRDTTNNRIFLDASVKAGSSCRVFTLRTAQNTDIGDTNGRVLFVFLPNFAQSMGTS